MNDICVICGKRMPTRICECGFDISKNYDSYRTLSVISKNSISTYQKRLDFEKRKSTNFEVKKVEKESIDGSLEYEKAKILYENREFIEAIAWYRKAAEKGHERAMIALGLYLLNGSAYGVDDHPELAKKWWLQALQSQDNATRKTAQIYLESYLGIYSEERLAIRQNLYKRLCRALNNYMENM